MKQYSRYTGLLSNALELLNTLRGQIGHKEIRAVPWSELRKWLAEATTDSEQREAVIIVGANFSHYSGRPVFGKEALAEIDEQCQFDLQFHWTTLYDSLQEPGGERLPRSWLESLSPASRRRFLLRLIADAPDDSSAPLLAAERYLTDCRSEQDIEAFRRTWTALPPRRREALAIGLYPDPYRHFGRFEGVTIIENPRTPLQLIVGDESYPVHGLTRPRWADRYLPQLRAAVWPALPESFNDFAAEAYYLGGEREQVGALLERLVSSLGQLAGKLGRASSVGAMSHLRIGRYVFSTKEENLWGPDFALMLLYLEKTRLLFGRYALFQAKLIQAGAIRVARPQLAALRRSSLQGSAYVAWEKSRPPCCIPTSLLDDWIRYAE